MPLATFTEAQYNALLAAYATGNLSVEYADKKVVYQSLTNMERILARMEAVLNPATSYTRIRHTAYTSGHFPTT